MGLLVPDLARFFGYSVDMLSLGLLWVPRAVRAVVGDCLAPRKLLCGLARLSIALFCPPDMWWLWRLSRFVTPCSSAFLCMFVGAFGLRLPPPEHLIPGANAMRAR